MPNGDEVCWQDVAQDVEAGSAAICSGSKTCVGASTLCEGRGVCAFYLTNWGDPCGGVPKYTEVQYTCGTSGDVYTKKACGEMGPIDCGSPDEPHVCDPTYCSVTSSAGSS
eukprot:GDKI01012583.1.p1 GENE.GDKI01012583.1~~GDKI01012583.1.p1  ORF type:complete len:111 (-),score=28.80 GDKI01012583.1:273-605(-)